MVNEFRMGKALNGKDPLIEFCSGAEKNNFITELEIALDSIEANINAKATVWQDYDMVVMGTSAVGKFQLYIDGNGTAFLESKKKKVIKKIAKLLGKSPLFERLSTEDAWDKESGLKSINFSFNDLSLMI